MLHGSVKTSGMLLLALFPARIWNRDANEFPQSHVRKVPVPRVSAHVINVSFLQRQKKLQKLVAEKANEAAAEDL